MVDIYRFGEFFSGPGGMSCGALKASESIDFAKMEPIFAVDYDKKACETYLKNIHQGEGIVYQEVEDEPVPGINVFVDHPFVLNADVRKVQPRFLPYVDVFMFGFPCNDFSNAGERKGLSGNFGMLYKEGLKFLLENKPKVFIAENVSGILHANNYGAFSQILNELQCAQHEDDGSNYIVTPHLYKFEEYGVPQTRHRVIIVGIRADVHRDLPRGFRPPAPTHEGHYVSAEEALNNLSKYETLPNHEVRAINDVVRRRLEAMEPGQNIWDINDTLPEELRLKNTGVTISSIYKKLDKAKPAYTVVGSGGGGTHMYHWDNRRTTDRERATFQTFPPNYEFVGGPTDTRRQIGMAVPPLGAQVIIEGVLKTLHGIDYASVAANLMDEMDPEFVEKKRAKKRKQIEAKERKAAREAEAEAEVQDLGSPALDQDPIEGLQDPISIVDEAA